MGKNRRPRTVQARKRYTRLGESVVAQGMAQGTYQGGQSVRVLTPVSVND